VKYNIVTINDDRIYSKVIIRKRLKGIDEVVIPATEGRKVDLAKELEARGLRIPDGQLYSYGEIGIWLSMFDCWKWCADNDEDLIVFEDDAMPVRDFVTKLNVLRSELPPTWDFSALWVPPNQLIDYQYMVSYDEMGSPSIAGILPEQLSLFDYGAQHVAQVYNGYGNVAMLYSPKGARALMKRAQEAKLYSPVDCFQYQEAHAGRLEGFAPKPKHADLVRYDWPETQVRNGDMYVG
jgi:GR25 family glycosyltransferase involved in LPS biosynthesis